MISIIKNLLLRAGHHSERSVEEAYDIWSGSYDIQPGNLMLDLDEKIFSGLMENIDLSNKKVADIGCGTGRHWNKLYEKKVAQVIGFDVSAGMLSRLERKFPGAVTYQITDNQLSMVTDKFVDCLISTLTIAHIRDIDEAIASWSRILKINGDVIITDFHPAILAKGGKRSFSHDGKTLSVLNYIHSIDKVKDTCSKHGLTVKWEVENFIDEEVKAYYEAQGALQVYEKFYGMPVIYGLHLKKNNVTE
jgi:ubiquinone/menaquinone biosynthesis C-methylase UbiE